MCDKIHFPSKTFAKHRAKQLLSKGLIKQKPYKCNLCNFWHLTSRLKMNYKRKVRGEVFANG